MESARVGQSIDSSQRASGGALPDDRWRIDLACEHRWISRRKLAYLRFADVGGHLAVNGFSPFEERYELLVFLEVGALCGDGNHSVGEKRLSQPREHRLGRCTRVGLDDYDLLWSVEPKVDRR